MPKQVELIVPRGPYLQLEWCAEGKQLDLHRVGMHRSTVVPQHTRPVCKNTHSHTHTRKSTNADAQKRDFSSLRFACPHITHKQTHKWVAVKEGPRLGWDRQLSHASFSASTALCPSFP